MNVKIVNLSRKGMSEVKDVVDMFSKDRGPLKFSIEKTQYDSDYYSFYSNADKIDRTTFFELSEKVRIEHDLNDEDFLVILSPRQLDYNHENSYKNWISFYVENNIIVKTGIYAEVSEGRDYLSISHQIIENLFQNLIGMELTDIHSEYTIHYDNKSCINDFSEIFNDVQGKMWSGKICRQCTAKAKERLDNPTYLQIKKILRRISNRLNDNYEIDFTPEELTVEVKLDYNAKGNGGRPSCSISIGGQTVDFGNIKRSSRIITYLFYLINANIEIGKRDFEGKGYKNTKENYERLHELLKGKLYERNFKSYLNSMTSYHSRISTLIENQTDIDDVGHMYRFHSKFIDQDVSAYSIHVEPENLILPKELLEYRVDRGQ
ncbi:hypothetical protein OAD66_02585 [Bacteroidia bacterium]|nr:hypothetical protein [Bacteroidia bacterium]